MGPSHDTKVSAAPPVAANSTTTHGGAFQTISATKQIRASAKSGMPPIALVKTGVLTLTELIEKMSVRPAELLGIEAGAIGAGEVAAVRMAAVCA